MKKIIEKFKPQGGKHCITNSLNQIFEFYKHPLTEEMLFGIGEGLDFTYIGLTAAPMVSGRSKIMEFEKMLAARLNIKINCKQNKDYTKVHALTKQMIDNEHPVLAYVDMPFLSYFHMDENNHFGGHSIVLFGYDEEERCYYVSDRDNSDYPIRTPKGSIHEDYHFVDYEQIQLARSSNFRPFPANNKYLEFDFSSYIGVNREILTASIVGVCKKMLNPPADLKGVNGIRKLSREIKKWNKFDSDKLMRSGITNYFQIHADGGTGGGIFRKIYGGFLMEAAEILQNNLIDRVGEQFIILSKQWDIVGDSMWKLSETCNLELLNRMSDDILELCDMETDLLTKLQYEIVERYGVGK